MNDATSQIIMSADLIAMSTHGRSGLTRLLFGSVAEAVLRQVLKSVSSGSLI
jgi:nucleotide-binding universal stress UspA family protein